VYLHFELVLFPTVDRQYSSWVFLVADTQLKKSLCPSVREHESESVKTRISAPAHPSATGIGRVSGLVFLCSPLTMALKKTTKTTKDIIGGCDNGFIRIMI